MRPCPSTRRRPMSKNTAKRKDTRRESGLDRRTFLKTAAASAALVPPATVVAQPTEAAPERRSTADVTGRRKQAVSIGGLSRARLDRMHDVMAGYVERGDVP